MKTVSSFNILVIGSLPGSWRTIGGTSVSLQHLVKSLENTDHVCVETVNTNMIRSGKIFGIFTFLSVVNKIFWRSRNVDIITLHVSVHALPMIGPITLLIAKSLGKPLLIRRFGGVLHTNLHGWRLWLADIVVKKSDVYLVQTRSLLASMHDFQLRNLRWFPTARPINLVSLQRLRTTCKKFVYISHIRKSKGIYEAIDAAKRLNGIVDMYVYGPFYDGLSEKIFNSCPNIYYGGILEPHEVSAVLAKNDVLLLPTYYEGEGYPGIILEAFAAGIPVITTNWKSIPEIVDDTCGIIVPPKDADMLYEAMCKIVFDDQLYKYLQQGAKERHKDYDLTTWTSRFIEYCKEVV